MKSNFGEFSFGDQPLFVSKSDLYEIIDLADVLCYLRLSKRSFSKQASYYKRFATLLAGFRSYLNNSGVSSSGHFSISPVFQAEDHPELVPDPDFDYFERFDPDSQISDDDLPF